MKLQNIHKISGSIRLISGLHIGAGKDNIEIGGLDQPVIKHPMDGSPYIPGSSIKGKMRSLLELYYFAQQAEATREFVVAQGRPCACGKKGCMACTIFGSSAKDKDNDLGPTRLMVRDAVLSQDDMEKHKKGDLRMEIKYENTIHRVKGTAEHPRPLERVPAGVCFDLNISLKSFENDPDLLDYVYKGFKLIELDALGGCSSRGCGQVRFENLRCDEQEIDLNTVAL